LQSIIQFLINNIFITSFYHLVDNKKRLFLLANMSFAQFKQDKQSIMQNFCRSFGDTGSPEVQVALLTERIKYLTIHLTQNKKDLATRLSLLKLVSQRTKLLAYLKRTFPDRYSEVITKLGLKRK